MIWINYKRLKRVDKKACNNRREKGKMLMKGRKRREFD